MEKKLHHKQGRKCGGCGGGGSPPQRNDPVGLKLRAVGLKIMRLFTCSALRSKLIFSKLEIDSDY
jgi:hypothetical protein